MYSMPRASWIVLRLVWIQVALCAAVLVESAIFHRSQIADLFVLNYYSIFPLGEVWRLLTAVLVHTNPFQLLFILLTLWMFGSELEQRWGRSVFLRFYLLCALSSSLTFLFLGAFFPMMRSDIFMTSTGPVLGLLIAYAIYWPERQVW
ncbi:MAG TPA: rhomboid family intramembrane serine protease, partial [Turneriella sp.]|nr:rhomboid family intramembrane serine protease [Turneriella sp.]